MNHSVHIRRFVRAESIPSLGFRQRAVKRFGALGISAVNDINLHATVAQYHHFTQPMESMAGAIRTQPNTSEQSITNRVTGARAFGQDKLAGTAWFSLMLDSPELTEDYRYYAERFGKPRSGIVQPHVTLLRANTIGSDDDIAEVNDWIRQRMPDTVNLKPVSIAWSMRNDEDSAPASRLAS